MSSTQIEQYRSLGRYKKELRKKLKQGLVPASVDIRFGPPSVVDMLRGRNQSVIIGVAYIQA